MSGERPQVWSRYWATGALHSCHGSFDQQYGGAFVSFWGHVAAELPLGARVLDLCTGSGALPRLFASLRREDGAWRCDGVDLAELPPPDRLGLADSRIHLHSSTSVEALPFDSACFDLVVSQYGLEYCDLALALSESLRVLRRHGRLALVLHHAESLPVRLARAEGSHIQDLLAADGLLDLAAGMQTLLMRARTPQGRMELDRDPAALALRNRFNAAQEQIEREIATSHCPDVLHEARQAIMQAFQEGPAGSARLQAYRQQLQDAQLRLSELVTHAVDEAKLSELEAQLHASGRNTQRALLHERGQLMAWSLLAG
ncbi:class I SAM-dependent methyltransferase [Inhella proteolytica]|uniref:Methyltransferase domain-containing protein n=1 Tax=Inhella proteolytica TaxID=2795029 RepID=A0A931J3V8_9BURK|nr:methyltransferase domain-containing protein [Inhella proteolytica]MBH9577720.1 methyltransferase domain-containing protein [Inhella proteolytica]